MSGTNGNELNNSASSAFIQGQAEGLRFAANGVEDNTANSIALVLADTHDGIERAAGFTQAFHGQVASGSGGLSSIADDRFDRIHVSEADLKGLPSGAELGRQDDLDLMSTANAEKVELYLAQTRGSHGLTEAADYAKAFYESRTGRAEAARIDARDLALQSHTVSAYASYNRDADYFQAQLMVAIASAADRAVENGTTLEQELVNDGFGADEAKGLAAMHGGTTATAWDGEGYGD